MGQAPGYEARAELRFQSILHALSRLNADTSRDSSFTNVLVGLGMGLYLGYGEARSGIEHGIIARAALGTRNLLELRYWTSFAAKSETNIWRIRQDAVIDGRDMLDKFAAICAIRPELSQVVANLDQARASFDQQCVAHGISASGKYLRVADLASDLGLDDEYRAMGSFLSKLLHPTGLSICLADTEEFLKPHLMSVAAWYFNDSYERLNIVLGSLHLPRLE